MALLLEDPPPFFKAPLLDRYIWTNFSLMFMSSSLLLVSYNIIEIPASSLEWTWQTKDLPNAEFVRSDWALKFLKKN